MTEPLLLAALPRLTPRDQLVCDLLFEHRILTTNQLADIAFHSSRVVAKRRLLVLEQLRLVTRFRPLKLVGSNPYYYLLDDAGAALVAARRGAEEVPYRKERVSALAYSTRLAHMVGVNDALAALMVAARECGATISAWKSERSWENEPYAQWVHPDACGRWTAPAGVQSDFFLEYDRGTEPVQRLVAKLHDYAGLARHTGLMLPPVLFWFLTDKREVAARRALRGAHMKSVPVATSACAADDPAGRVWRHLDADDDEDRVSLGDLLAERVQEMGLLRQAV